MSTNFFFKSLCVNNYRGLQKLEIESLRRVNLIGGLNGTGKSTLLDAIFLYLDRRSPISLMRPYHARGLQLPFPHGLDYVFGKSGKDVPAEINTVTKQGTVNLSITRGVSSGPINVSTSNPLNPIAQGSPTTLDVEQIGIQIKVLLNGQEDESSFMMQTNPEGIAFNLNKPGTASLAPGAFISSTAKVPALEDAQRYSAAMKTGRIKEVVQALNFVNPDLVGFHLLQEGSQPILYAELADGSLMHSSHLGGGFQNVLSIVLLLLSMKDGVVLFDEVDSAIHYSKLTFFWGLIGRLAEQQNCQVFAVTHSRECIAHAATGFSDRNKLADLQYMRLQNGTGQHTECITYTGEELCSAIESNWEIR